MSIGLRAFLQDLEAVALGGATKEGDSTEAAALMDWGPEVFLREQL